MEIYKYDKVNTADNGNVSTRLNNDINANKKSWMPFLRQIFVCSGVCTIYFVLGLCFGAPTVIIPQMRKEANSTEAVSVAMESWLTSVHGYSALPWVLIIPIFTQLKGRKTTFLFVCISTIVACIVLYCSINTMQLLISEIIQGILLASNMTLLIVIVTEYTSSPYRKVCLSFKCSLFFWGVWLANATGTFLHWKNIGIIALFCSVYSLTAIVWPESPSWLAMKGRFEECAAAHHWLMGFDTDSERELKILINSQKEYLKECKKDKVLGFKHQVRHVLGTISTKEFYQPLLLAMGVMSLYHFSGKFVCTMYAIELIKKMTENEYSAYMGMLILEGITIVGMHLGCVLSKFIKTKKLLLGSSIVGTVFLFLISLYLYLIKLSIIIENKTVSISLLTLFSVSISCGPMILPDIIFGEIILLRYKSSSLLILTLYSECLMATVLIMAPYMFKMLSLYGAFFFYGLSASSFIFILYKFLPESKDSTIQEMDANSRDVTDMLI